MGRFYLSEIEAERATCVARQGELVDLEGRGAARERVLTAAESFLARYDALMAVDDARSNLALHEIIERISIARHKIVSVILRS